MGLIFCTFLAASAAAGPLSVVLVDDLSDGGRHASAMQARLQAIAPQAQVSQVDAGRDLSGLRQALSSLSGTGASIIVFGVDHPGFDQQEYQALAGLDAAGVLLVAPSGNHGDSEPLYPAAYPFVASAGALDAKGQPAAFNSLHQNLKFLLPGAEGSSFAAAALAGQAARLLAQGAPRAGLLARLQQRRRGHAPGPRTFEADDAVAASLSPAAGTRASRRRPDHALLVLAPGAPPTSKWLAQLKAHGIRPEHAVPGAGAVIAASDRDLVWLLSQPWAAQVTRGLADPTALSAAGRRLTGLWQDLYFGGLEARGLGPTGEPGGALVGCDAPPKLLQAALRQPLERQGLFAPSPPRGAAYNDTSVYLAGRVAVGVFLPESSGTIDPNYCNWTPAQEANVQAKIVAALDFIRAENPSAQVEFVYDWHFRAACDYEPIVHPGYASSGLWTQNVVAKLGYGSVRAYNDALRKSANADWAYSIFVANDQGYAPSKGFFPDGKFAFAYLGGPYLVMTYTNDNWGIANMDSVCAHESGHIFWALDEYAGPSNPSQRSGYFNELNRNSVSGGTLNDPVCPMRGTIIGVPGTHYCSSTRLHLGWRDIDADGKTDVLDTFPLSAWSPPPPASAAVGAIVPFHGLSTDQALAPLGPLSAVTLNAVTLVQYRVNGGPWTGAAFDDGSGDESQEAFNFNVGPLAAGSTLVEARGVNSAGNTETALLAWTLLAGTPTISATASPTQSVSPTLSATPSASPSPTPTPSASSSPTFGPSSTSSVSSTLSASPSTTPSATFGPSATPAGSCGVLPALSTIGVNGTSTQMARMFLHGGVPHLYTLSSGGARILRYQGGAWSEVAGSPLVAASMVTTYESVVDPDSGDLWFLAYSKTCAGCLATGSLTAMHWNGSSVIETSLPWPGTLNGPTLVFHQGRPWILDGRGASGLLALTYQGGAWVQDGLVTPTGGAWIVLQPGATESFSAGGGIVVMLYNATTAAYELWAYKDGTLNLLDDMGGGAYSYTAGLAFDAANAYIVFQGTSPRAIRVRLSDMHADEVSKGLNDFSGFAYLDAYGGSEGVYAAIGRAHPQGPWVDLLRFNGSYWEPLNCGVGLPANNVSTLMVEGGHVYTTLIESGELSVHDCPLTAPCPDPSVTPSPTAGPYYSPSPTRTGTSTVTLSPWPSRTASPTFTPTPPGTLTATPSPTPHLCGTVIRVCLSGACDFTRIADAIAMACPGDRIEVEGGNYAENGLTVDKDLQIVGVPGFGIDGAEPQPRILATSGPGVLWLDLASPHSVTITNLALDHATDLDGVRLSLSAGSWVHLQQLQLAGTAGHGVNAAQGLGNLLIENCLFRGYTGGGQALRIDTTAGSSGSAVVRYNSFLSLAPAVAVSLAGPAPYSLQLLGDLVFNGGVAGTDALDLKGDAAASGNYDAWFGYSSFYGGLAPGAADKAGINPVMADPSLYDPHYLVSSPLAYAGTALGTGLDALGDTRPAAGQTLWSLGACEPVTATITLTPSPSLTLTLSPAMTATPTASPSASSTVSPSSTATPSVTPTLSPTPSASPSSTWTPSITLTWSPTPSITLTVSPTRSPTLVQSPTDSPTPGKTPTATLVSTAEPGSTGVETVIPVPNPDPHVLAIRLGAPVSRMQLAYYSPAMVLLARQDLGAQVPGWVRVPLPAGFSAAGNSVVFLKVTGFTGDAAVRPSHFARLVFTQ